MWTYLKSNEKRNLDTVHLDGNKKELLLEDVEKFLSEGVKKIYKERGIPYRRGYLLVSCVSPAVNKPKLRIEIIHSMVHPGQENPPSLRHWLDTWT